MCCSTWTEGYNVNQQELGNSKGRGEDSRNGIPLERTAPSEDHKSEVENVGNRLLYSIEDTPPWYISNLKRQNISWWRGHDDDKESSALSSSDDLNQVHLLSLGFTTLLDHVRRNCVHTIPPLPTVCCAFTLKNIFCNMILHRATVCCVLTSK